jgi:hypothetical protein
MRGRAPSDVQSPTRTAPLHTSPAARLLQNEKRQAHERLRVAKPIDVNVKRRFAEARGPGCMQQGATQSGRRPRRLWLTGVTKAIFADVH